MKNLKTILVVMVLSFGLVGPAFSTSATNQTVGMQVNSICVLAVTGNPSTLTVTAPTTGGQTPVNGTSATTYAQYTSTVGTSQARRLSAAWGSSDAAPAGCSLKLTATPAGGNEGSSAGQISLTATAQDVVTAIKSCATGTGANSGAQLSYSLQVSDATALVAGESKSATVTLTLTDAA